MLDLRLIVRNLILGSMLSVVLAALAGSTIVRADLCGCVQCSCIQLCCDYSVLCQSGTCDMRPDGCGWWCANGNSGDSSCSQHC
jgi:hypothetical protein